MVLFHPLTGNGYLPEKNTHPLINEKALDQSGVMNYLNNQLGFIRGIDEKLNGKKVSDWIKQGGTDEDKDNWYRGMWHFHDPTKEWRYAGIFGMAFSSLDWSQNKTIGPGPTCSDLTPLDVPCTQPPPGSNPTWSWPAARNYYYQALTSGDPTVRGEKFGKTFLALGHVMHLLADTSVPEHSRNDQHFLFPKGSRYEQWAEGESHDTGKLPTFIAQNSSMVYYSVVTNQSNVPGYSPISNFWDTTPDAGNANPGNGGTLIGLAEYTNYNFLSPGTIFKNYPYPINPQYGMKYLEYVAAEDGQLDNRIYFSGITSDSRPIQHFVSTGYLWADLQSVPTSTMDSAKFILDENCYKDYAYILVPKAVAYDAALLDYFFRGALDVSWPETGVYSIADGSQTPCDANGNHHQQFTKIKAAILNTTPNEAIGAGTLTAVARYKIIPNYAPDLSNYPPDGSIMSAVTYSYSVSKAEEVNNISANAYDEVTFDFSLAPIPAGITDLTLQVVFKGTIGSETDNAIAVGMKDITEPTHLTFWNLSDMFSLKYPGTDYVPYTFETLQTMAQQSASLLDWLDDTNDGSLNDEVYLKPYTSTFTISFWNNSAMVPATTVDIPAGGHIRMLVLVNQSANNYVELKWHDPVNSDSVTLPFTGVVDQADQSGAYTTPTPVDTFREKHAEDWQTLVPIKQHNYAGVVGCKPATGSTYCPYSDEDADPVTLTPTQFTTDFN